MEIKKCLVKYMINNNKFTNKLVESCIDVAEEVQVDLIKKNYS